MTSKDKTPAPTQTTPKPKTRRSTANPIEAAAREFIGDKVLKIPEKSKEDKIARLSAAQHLKLQEIEENAIAEFGGDLSLLESALGMLRVGHHFGWKVLYIIHSKRTIRTYEEILGIKIRDIFPETGPSSYRSHGWSFAQAFSNFWKVAGGDIKIQDRNKVGT